MVEISMKKMKRDIQGKFALKNDDYREVRSLRLTDDTWKKLVQRGGNKQTIK